ncbi:PREDICTED: uncharacterized protein LOC109232655 [Nicotiana attenuata]|uniref:uncharacterized protein LOC109232655 n=1 Tax=Nicotiana attenuata TaxID=49451 RepID=UPI000904662A|nr:PREDICTED: uncharacterized protein LOC109232655 [Nicotiana attenuata]
MEDCGLVDLGFYRPKYTWSNVRGQCSIRWKWLDRGLANDHWLEAFPATTISHLDSAGYDHNPLLLELPIRHDSCKKYFKFLNCWVNNNRFLPLVSEIWSKDVRGSAMWIFHQKIKAQSHALSLWSRQQYGDIFQIVKEFEQKVKDAEMIWAQTNTDTDRATLNEFKAQYVRHLKVEQDVLKQKTQLQWFKEGDANSIYFHSLIRGRRRKLYIYKINNKEGQWFHDDENIGKDACNDFRNHFTDPGHYYRRPAIHYPNHDI